LEVLFIGVHPLKGFFYNPGRFASYIIILAA
jgi:hypothetical protein